MSVEFTPPEFISRYNVETIHEKMLEALPKAWDKTEAGAIWNLTRPTAVLSSEMIDYQFMRTIMLMFPMYSWGTWLDLHANAVGTERNKAQKASTMLTVSGPHKTKFEKGAIFTTEGTSGKECLEFVSLEDFEIPESGLIRVPIEAKEVGDKYNVATGTIILLGEPRDGVTVTNEERAYGGVEEESDEDLKERIRIINESNNKSFVGNDADYRRWAMECDGVGYVDVIPEWKGEGTSTVKLVITDYNGEPAGKEILDRVYDYIMSPGNKMDRRAPIGAILTVTAPEIHSVSYSAKVTLEQGFSTSDVEKSFAISLKEYYKIARAEGIIKYNKVHALLTNVTGIADFTDLYVDDSKDNVILKGGEYPDINEITLIHVMGDKEGMADELEDGEETVDGLIEGEGTADE